jgi:hypothetical protein
MLLPADRDELAERVERVLSDLADEALAAGDDEQRPVPRPDATAKGTAAANATAVAVPVDLPVRKPVEVPTAQPVGPTTERPVEQAAADAVDDPPNRYLRQDVLGGLLVMGLALAAIVWWPMSGGSAGRADAAGPGSPMACSADPGIRTRVVPIDGGTANARIEVTSESTQAVTIKELFMRSPAAFKGDEGIDSVLVPPARATVTRDQPYAWNAELGGPVHGTVVGIYRPPWGNNAVHVTWTGPGGVTCDEYR